MPLIAHPVILPDLHTHTLLSAWVTTSTQNLSRLLSLEGFKRAQFFFTTVLPLRPGVVNVQSLSNPQTISKLSQNSFTIASSLHPSSHPSQLQLRLSINWEPQSQPQDLFILTLNPERLTPPWILLNQSEITNQEKQLSKSPSPTPLTKPKKKKPSPTPKNPSPSSQEVTLN